MNLIRRFIDWRQKRLYKKILARMTLEERSRPELPMMLRLQAGE